MIKIDYCNGFIEIAEAGLKLKQVKENVKNCMSCTSCTQADVKIIANGELVAVSRWIGLAPTEEDLEDDGYVMVRFGDFGFYTNWQDS